MNSKKVLSLALVCLVAVGTFAAIEPGYAGPKAKPLNAGKDGFKSNAGVGNGTEDVQVGDPVTVTTYSSSSSESTTSSSTEPVVTSTVTTTTEIGRVRSDTPDEQVGHSDNFKRYYDVTYEVVTTVGTETTVTYVTTQVTDVYKTDTTTTDMADVDPGHSQPVNQAPEGQPEDIVVVDTSLDSTSSQVSSSSSVEVGTDTSSSQQLVEDVQVLCNGSEGQNTGTNYCGL